MPEMEAIRSPGRWMHDVLPMDGAKTIGSEIGRQLNLLEVCIVRHDQMWPSTQ
jgi:hypothetical protein